MFSRRDWSILWATSAALLVVVLVWSLPRPAHSLDEVEYELARVLVIAAAVEGFRSLEGGLLVAFEQVVDGLEEKTEEARLANAIGDDTTEVSKLSAALGHSNSIQNMVKNRAPEIADLLGEYTNLASVLRQAALERITGQDESTCGDGVIDSGEECDPQAQPSGCAIEGEICSIDCRCFEIVEP